MLFIITFSVLSLNLAHGRGAAEEELVNKREIPTDQINTIVIRYRSEAVTLLRHNSDTIVIREYMSRNNSYFFANVTHSGNELIITGRRPMQWLFPFRSRVEISIPASNRNVTIRTSSGRIKVLGEHTVSSLEIESSSGRVSVNSVTADRVKIETSSGTITVGSINGDVSVRSLSGRIELNQVSGSLTANTSSGVFSSATVNGNIDIRTNSGNIVIGSIDGNVSARTTSGRIELDKVNGTVDISSSSGVIRCTVAENAGDISITTSSGGVVLNLPNNFAFNFLSRTSSGMLHTPFTDQLAIPLADRNTVQGVIVGDNIYAGQIHRNINIRTSSGSIRVNWAD